MATLELTNNLLAEIGGWPALKEARTLVERGRVSDVQRDGAVIRARVQGAEKIYEAQITLADRAANVEVRCTCAESRRKEAWKMNQEFNVLALLKGDESYVYVYDDTSTATLVEKFHAHALNSDLSLNWFDAAVLTQKAEEQTETTPTLKKARF